MKKTTIIATLGPNICNKKAIVKLVKAGANAIRLNFSHGDYNFFENAIKQIRLAEKELKQHIPIIQDLCGPKIRINTLDQKEIQLHKNQVLTISLRDNTHQLYINLKSLIADLAIGKDILLKDGKLIVRVIAIDKKKQLIEVKVIQGGILTNKAGVNLPNINLSIPSITEKDKKDLKFGMAQGIDYVALSFVRTKNDIIHLKELIKSFGGDAHIIAKIERKEAIENLIDIIKESDGIMIARGDLGIELSIEQLPILQKDILLKSNFYGKFTITATQMLLSMVNSTQPTRSEALDIANAVIDGSDVLMLSDETATGSYPCKAVETMSNIIKVTEAQHYPYSTNIVNKNEHSLSWLIEKAASSIANSLKAKYICCVTRSGYSARLLSLYKPDVPIIAVVENEKIARRVSLFWGTKPMILDNIREVDSLLPRIVKKLTSEHKIKKGESIVITLGLSSAIATRTNTVTVYKVEKL